MSDVEERKGILAWFANNHVAANFLMLFVVSAGLLSIFTAKMEVFPEFSLDTITVTIPYRGASPADVEEGVIVRVEEAIAGVEGIKRMISTAAENVGTTVIEVEEYADPTEVLDDVKAQIDTITTFPLETEAPIIAEVPLRRKVITIVLYGDVSEQALKTLADQIHDDLTAMENISQVSISGVRPYEISIEVSEEALRRYNLTFEQVSRIVSRSSLDVPGGSIETAGGEILVRTKGQRYRGPEFERISLLTRPDGTYLRLGDIATVRDEFEDVDLYAEFDGERATFISVSRIGEQDAIDVANTVKDYVADKAPMLPAGVSLALWEDDSQILRDRLSLLRDNGYFGLILVFLCLALFLNIRLAFWTALGIPISFLGAFYLIQFFDVTINMISLFAFIMVLGLVVDDAIVVGENIFAYGQRGMTRMQAAIQGVREMAIPVTLAVLTTQFAFAPLAFTSGIMGKILRVMPIVVVCVLLVSLVEALLILPAHLSGGREGGRKLIGRYTDRVNEWTDRMLRRFVDGPFARFVDRAVRWRYVTLASGVAVLIVIAGLIAGGYLKFVFFETVEADNMIARVSMPLGTPVERTQVVVERLEQAALQAVKEWDERDGIEQPLMKHIAVTVGAQPSLQRGGPAQVDMGGDAQSHLGEVNVELLSAEKRTVSSVAVANRWRELVGEIPGVATLTFVSEFVRTGNPIEVELSHRDFETLVAASERLKAVLRDYEGVSDIADDFEPGKAEVKLDLKETGRLLGLTLSDLAQQVRQGFYGEEAQRIQRGRHDIRVMVRYPEAERRSLADIETMRIRLPDGTEIPFRTVADVEYGRGYATIQRIDRRRVVSVTADVDESVANTGEINAELNASVLPRMQRELPGLQFRFGGEQRERNESLGSLWRNFAIALMAIYALLAVQFRSYSQPAIVMSAIPFGLVGAALGHLVMGFNLSLLSMFGIVALAGVVVNDSLIMIDLINRERRPDASLVTVLRESAMRRFRPIMLTTLTTFFGLLPMITERSLQARFLIPMAISLAFGVMFATAITLFLVPSLYMVLEDIKVRVLRMT